MSFWHSACSDEFPLILLKVCEVGCKQGGIAIPTLWLGGQIKARQWVWWFWIDKKGTPHLTGAHRCAFMCASKAFIYPWYLFTVCLLWWIEVSDREVQSLASATVTACSTEIQCWYRTNYSSSCFLSFYMLHLFAAIVCLAAFTHY